MRLANDSSGHRLVLMVDNVAYDNLAEVADTHPQLGMEQCMALYCEAWVRQHHGGSFCVIRHADDFKRRYRVRTQRGRNTVSASQSAEDFGVYDVTEISEPKLHDDVLRCYVEDRQYGVPYRVDLPWPVRTDAVVEFVLLPMQYDEDANIY
jgi:hypothetical protein